MSLPPPPDNLDLTESRIPEIVAALATTWAIATICVPLRFFARRLKGYPLWIDDWLALFSLVCASVAVWVIIGYVVPHGTGKHIWVAPAQAMKVWAIGIFIGEIAYSLTLSAVKWSILAFYWRIFGSTYLIRVPIWTLLGLVTAWCIAVLGVIIFQCSPPRALWERFDPVSPMPPDEFVCDIDANKFFYGNSIPSIITDIFIILLPLPSIIKLQLPILQKVAVVFIFTLGAFVTIISIIRLVFILNLDLKSPDVTWNITNTLIWSYVETNIAIVCCRLPSLKPLYSIALNGILNSAARSSDLKSGNANTLDRHRQPGLCDPGYSHSSTQVVATNGSSNCVDDERSLVRLDERDLNSFNGDLGSGHELANVSHANGIAITADFILQGHAAV
ncbi:integral membrane protein [Fusarium austroafricanum]|uniref:Integral membrane protein n=1 Tax=Fusarium austroafricanum TaxID=2364996 RepID=A0A8H4KAV7_9HYPO|nr:integral membrane protein [Fusarium austroafricanum]